MTDAAHYDVVIAGGAAIGAAVAWHLLSVDGGAKKIAVIERDRTFRDASTSRSAASIRQQFSTPQNIRLSQYGLKFLADMAEHQGPQADPGLILGGYLILAGRTGQAALQDNHRVQTAEGAPIRLLDANALARAFSWLNCDGLAAGAHGEACEGWFDADALLQFFWRDLRAAGVPLIEAEITAIETTPGCVTGVRLADGRRIGCGALVNACGPGAGALAALAGRPLPVEPRKRTIFVVDCPAAPDGLPLVADPSGIWVRPEGRYHLAGYSPPAAQDRTADPHDLEPDHGLFDEKLWPALAARIRAFETLKVINAWAGHYDFNTADQNAVIGPDPELPNFIYANGFSGHGLQHAPGVGRAVAEWLTFGAWRSIDLSVFGYERITQNHPLIERAVI
jgi:glycine/D-amino acid oxidase-like deaminating enzyme